MRGPRLVLLVAALFSVGPVATSSCSRNRAQKPVALQVHLNAEPVTLDPHQAEDGIALKILANVMEGLVCLNGAGEVNNCLAEKVELSADERVYSFALRSQAAWSDGRPVRAEDFVLGLRRVLDPATAAKQAHLLFPIRGAAAVNAGKKPVTELGVREADGKVVIELERPTPFFLQLLALPMASPARKDVLDANDGRWPEKSPVTGAYQIAFHTLGESILLEQNPSYWGYRLRPQTRFLPVMLRIVGDEATALSLFETGKIDVLGRIPAYDLERMRKTGRVRTDPFLATYYLAFNTKKGPFQSRDWRRAVSGAIHRAEITKALGSGEFPARSWIPPLLEGNLSYADPAPVFADSMKKIRAEISKKSSAPISLAFDTSGRNTSILEKVQADLKTELGLSVSLNNSDWKSHIKGLATDPAPIFRFGWLAPIRDPIPHLEVFTTGNKNNYGGWSNARYDQLVTEIGALKPGPARLAKIEEAQKILVDHEAGVVPLYHYVQTHLVSPRVTKFRVSPFGIVRFDEVEIAQ